MPSLRLLLLLPALPCVFASAADAAPAPRTAVLLDENFEKLHPGPIAPGAHDHIVSWEGTSEREYGYASVAPAPSRAKPGGHGNTLALHDLSARSDQSASLLFRWSPAPRVSVAWDFLVEADDPFLGIHFLGNNWDDAAAIVLLANGVIHVQHAGGDTDRAVIGIYRPGEWRSLRLDLDSSTRTFDLHLDGKKVLSGLGWQRSAASALSVLSTVGDYSTAARDGAAVLRLDNIKVIAAAGGDATAPARK